MIKPSRIDQVLTLVVLALLIVGCYFVLRPFMSAIVWAAVLTVTAWPLFQRTRRALHGRTALAATLMVLLIAAMLLAPFVIVGATIAENFDVVSAWARQLVAQGPPEPPAWVSSLPLVGERLAAYWGGFSHDTARVLEEGRKLIEPAREYLLKGGGSVLSGIIQLTLSIIIAFFFFTNGDALIGRLHGAAERIAGEHGRRLAQTATLTVRGVVLGIFGTALAQAVLMAIGLWIAGVAAAPLLGLLTFFLSPVPIGPPLVWIPVGLWLLNQGATAMGIFILLWGTFVVSMVDNVIKPLIISRGAALPFALVLLGVLGGAIAFGIIGVFLGPVLLAVGYALLKEWAVDAAARAAIDSEVPPDSAGRV
jgi:predicted PurR-regulated permease PerM